MRTFPSLALAALALLANAGPVFAQTPVGTAMAASPIEVWLACRHPSASEAAELTLNKRWETARERSLTPVDDPALHQLLASREVTVQDGVLARFDATVKAGPLSVADRQRFNAIAVAFAIDSVRGDFRADHNLMRLCGKLNIRPEHQPNIYSTWVLAMTGKGAPIPSATEVHDFAEQAQSRRIALERELAVIYAELVTAEGSDPVRFAPGVATVDLAASAGDLQKILSAVLGALASGASKATLFGAGDPGATRSEWDRLAKARAASVRRALATLDPTLDLTRVTIDAHPFPAGATTLPLPAPSPAAVKAQARLIAASIENQQQHDAAASRAIQPGFEATGRGVAVALTDVVLRQAQADLRESAMEELNDLLCRGRQGGLPVPGDLPKPRFTMTCAFATLDDAERYQPNPAMFRAALLADMSSYLDTVIVTHVQRVNAEPGVAAERAAAVLGMLEVAQTVAKGGSLSEALEYAVPLVGAVHPESSFVAQALILARATARVVADARGGAMDSTDVLIAPDTLVLYAARALAVNVGDPLVSDPAFKDLRSLMQHVKMLNLVRQLRVASRASEMLRQGRAEADRLGGVPRLATSYTSAVNALLLVASPCLPPSLQRSVEGIATPVRDLGVALAGKQFRSSLIELQRIAVALADQTPVAANANDGCFGKVPVLAARQPVEMPAVFLRTLTFVADVAEARDQAEVEAAVQGFVARGRGYRSKRLGAPRIRLGITAYAGGLAALGSTGNTGAFMPIGFDLSRINGAGWRAPRAKWLHTRSMTLLLYPVDLGSLAALRIKAPDNDPGDVELQQLFAPGASALLSLGRLPLAAGLNFQRRPTNTSTATRWHAGIILASDVPLF